MASWLIWYGGGLLAWSLLLFALLSASRRPRDASRRPLWLVLLGLAISLTVSAPAIDTAIGRLSGDPDLPRFLQHASILLIAWAAQTFLWRMNHSTPAPRPRLPYRTWGLVLVLATMSLLFILAPTPPDGADFADWDSQYIPNVPWALEYWIAYVAYLAPAFANMTRLGLRYARITTNPVLALGLRLASLGALGALVYHLDKTFFLAAHRLEIPYPALLTSWPMRTALPLAAHLLVLVGATIPIWGPRLGVPALLDWFHHYRTYQRLRPLWLALYRTNPDIALMPAASALIDRLAVRDLGLRTYRRVIEIRDGRLALQPYLDPGVTNAARTRAAQFGLTGQALDAIAEAATLHAAIAAKTLGKDPNPAAATLGTVPGGHHMDSDTAFLQKVAHAYRQHRRRYGFRRNSRSGVATPY